MVYLPIAARAGRERYAIELVYLVTLSIFPICGCLLKGREDRKLAGPALVYDGEIRGKGGLGGWER